jgi:RES domain-containing protein
MVYTAGSLSLAALEILVHLDAPEILGRYVSIPVRFDDSICARPDPASLPADWAREPAPLSTQALGSQWVEEARCAVLAVPSVVVRMEWNFLINPNHPDIDRIEIGVAADFRFDPRLVKN